MGIFFKHSRAANSAVCGRIVQNFELVRDIIVVPLTCKNEEDPIKNEGAGVLTRLYIVYCEADLRLCFRIYKKLVFSQRFAV